MSEPPKKDAVLVFVKSPRAGAVKSRLARDIGEDTAFSLYRNFVLDIMTTVEQGSAKAIVCFSPAEDEKPLKRFLGDDRSYLPQQGNDLGERMRNAFVSAFSLGFGRAILIGSDIPDLPSALIDEAFSRLDRCEAVIGPATDGGYYLIGFRRDSFLPDVFDGMAWSTPSVFHDTMAVFERRNHAVQVLPERRDIDTAEDLVALFLRSRGAEFRHSRTMTYLAAHCSALFREAGADRGHP